ncbi:MAG: Kelch repeat-containing protein, partial [Alphaproteobacteria bacterium]
METFLDKQMGIHPLTPTSLKASRPIKRLAAWLFIAVVGLLASIACAVPSLAQIVGTAQLNVERRGHTATLLDDGKILIVGGDNQSGMVSLTELLDPTEQTSAAGPSLATARTDHTATSLSDGRVLVIGGRDSNGALTSTEIYNPLTGAFTAGPSLTTPRSGHTATILSDGKILIAGGDASGSAELYDPTTESFSLVAASMSISRKFHSAILIHSGQVLIVGGVNAQDAVLKTAEVFDPSSQSFNLLPTDLQTPRALAALKLLADGKVQIIGGDAELSMEVFDPTTGIFNAKALLPPNGDLLGATLSTQSRAALFSPVVSQDPLLQGILTPEQVALLDRADQSITELPARNQALVAGGVNNAGQVLNSAMLVKSSSTSVTTDKTDYAPGEIVTITGTGFQPNEQIDIYFHEFPEEYPDIFLSAVANQQGNFIASEFAPQPIDIGRTFTLTVVGLSSGFTGQTVFTDGTISLSNLDIKEFTCSTDTSNFSQGETVCAKFDETFSGGGTATYYKQWYNSTGSRVQSTQRIVSASSTGHTDTYSLSSSAPTGIWKFVACGNNNNPCNAAQTLATQTFNVTAANTAPNAPPSSSLAQFKSDGSTSIAVGGATNQTAVVLKGTVSDPDASDTVKLQVEVKPIGTAFNGAISEESGLLTNGSTASVTVSGLTPGISYHWQARTVDNNGAASSFVSFGSNLETEADFKVDTTPPQIDCTVPDQTMWYGADVSVTCSASDSGSGLANSGDANFTLTTNVASATETANATTDSRQVCDRASNCATAGPYTFRVDKKAPVQATCDAPDGAWHNDNVALHCNYTDGGSGPASQQINLTTNVPAGNETNNAIASANGAQACDAVGNCAASPADIA